MKNKAWLLKTEPNEFSIDDLKACGDKGEPWNGIRNYQARNFLREMSVGDTAFIYHSACAIPAIVGLGKVIRTAYDDPEALDSGSKYFDPKSKPDAVRWSLVNIQFIEKWSTPISLKELKTISALAEMKLISQSRLSVSPVLPSELELILDIKR